MNTKEYDQKKWECWAAFKKQSECEGGCLMADAFFHAFDRAYALGKQTETVTKEEIEKAATVAVRKEYLCEKCAWKDNCDFCGGENTAFDCCECPADSYEDGFKAGANFALGKQEKDAERTTPNNRLKARRKSDGEIIEVREWRGVSDVIYSSPDMNQFYQASELDFNVDAEKTVIQGWVARDYDGDVFLYQNEPDRNEIAWNGYMMHSLPIDSFPDLTWESEPEPVEIIIKRKKEWIKN